MKRFLNEGLPLESGIRAALRYHREQLKRHKVKTDFFLKARHELGVKRLSLMESQFAERGSVDILASTKKSYLELDVAKPELLGLVPAELLLPTGELDVEAARRRDVLDLILHHEKGQ